MTDNNEAISNEAVSTNEETDTGVQATVEATEGWLKFTSKFTDAQLVQFHEALVEAALIVPLEAVDSQSLADYLGAAKVEHVEAVLACSALIESGILEVLMDQPLQRGPAGKDQSAPHTRPNGSKSSGGRVPKESLGPKVALPAADDVRVVATVRPNPKKPSSKSFVRYALYTPGITVKDFIAAGGYKADIKYDLEHNFITLVEPAEWAKTQAGESESDSATE